MAFFGTRFDLRMLVLMFMTALGFSKARRACRRINRRGGGYCQSSDDCEERGEMH